MAEDKNSQKYEAAIADRSKYVDAIVKSPASKKVIVAGPGTGKTYLFKLLLEGKKNSLALTFINALVADLSLELCGLADVRTLHGFARSVLHTKKTPIKVAPKLKLVLTRDAELLLGEKIDFDEVLYRLDYKHKHLAFYKARREFYDHFGHTDLIFSAVDRFRAGTLAVPKFELVLVDEYQDFNPLEIALIDFLARVSPIALAGDDDQALYDFKLASPNEIRERHSENNKDFESFTLPYCSRCSRVIVDATNDLIKNAQSAGLLKGRAQKQYLYFDDKNKDKVCAQHPEIVFASTYDAQVPWFIQKSLTDVVEHQRKNFSVLVISPINSKARSIAKALRKKGFKNVSYAESTESPLISLTDALRLLLKDVNCPLGWRMALECVLDEAEVRDILNDSIKKSEPLHALVPKSLKKKIKSLLASIRRAKRGQELSDEQFEQICDAADILPKSLGRSAVVERFEDDDDSIAPALRNIPIQVTTIERSKGLAADYVFLTHFDDQYMLTKGKPTDRDVYRFLVALTRAKNEIYLVSTSKKDPLFLGWIESRRIKRV